MKLKFSILIILLASMAQLAKAQSTASDYSMVQDTCLPTTVEEYDRLVRFFRESSNEKHLFKVNLLAFALFDFDLSYERKINKRLNYNLNFYFPIYVSNTLQPNTYYDQQPIKLSAELKYFNNYNGKVQEIHKSNAFSGFYGSMGIGFYSYGNIYKSMINPYTGLVEPSLNYRYSYHYIAPYERVVWKTNPTQPSEDILFMKFAYGYQYRMGSIGFISGALKMGIGSNYSFSRVYLMPELEVKISFAISSFKRKKL